MSTSISKSAPIQTKTEPASIWKIKSFTILLSSVFLLTVGNKIYEIVLPLIIYEFTHSSVSVASMRTAELLPNLLFAVFIGVIVDRVDKKRWVLWMIGIQALLLLGLATFIKFNILNLPLYYVIGFLLMTFNYGFFNAQVSLTKLSVPTVHLTSANAKFSFTETFVSVMGPAISAVVLLLPDFSTGILLTALCYLICIVFLARLTVPSEAVEKRSSSMKNDLVEGWLAFKSMPILKTVTLFVIFLNCSITVVSTTILIFAKDVLELSSSALAIILSASGIGGLVGSMAARRLRHYWGLGRMFGISMALNGSAYLLLFITTNLISFIIALFLIGFAISLHSISVYTIRHEQTPSHLIGRIAGITGTFFRIGMPITMYFSGWMIEWWGTSSIFISATIWNLCLFALYLRNRLWRES